MRRKQIPWTILIVPLTVYLFFLDPAKAFAQTTTSRPVGLGFVHPLQTNFDVSQYPPQPADIGSRERTHVFFVNGADPLNLGGFHSLKEFVAAQGYPNTYFGQMAAGSRFYHNIKQIRASDPAARIVLIGFSGGTYVVRQITNELRRDGIEVDLLVYLAGDMLTNTAKSRPDNARRILNITGHGLSLTGGDLIWNGTNLDGAVNLRLPVRHIQVPSRRDTIQLLMNEISAATASPAFHS